jgi:hypothetical protein
VNAVEHFAAHLPGDAVRRLAALRVTRFDATDIAPRRDVDPDEARALVIARWRDDLCGLLNAMTRGELIRLAGDREPGLAPGEQDRRRRCGSDRDAARSPELRLALWRKGADLERGAAEVTPGLQPRPVLLGGHLVIQAAPRGLYSSSERWPRALPSPRPAAPPADEPDGLDELLAAAERAIGVRLGRRGRDKGAWGTRAAALLGVVERGNGEPDWRGDVEIKTVAVARERSACWRVVEDPAIAMLGETAALAKLQRTLWLARADAEDGDATIIGWYLLEYDAALARLVRRYLHVRPKGPAGTDQRGLYLHKRFFADAGLLATLNGPTP